MTVVPASGVVGPAGSEQAGPSPPSDVVPLLRLAHGPRVMPPLLRQPPLAAFAVRPAPAVSPAPALPPILVLPPIPAVPPVPAVLDESMVDTTAMPGMAAWAAIAFALAQRGLPYVWGGDGPQRGEAGFDCSGLTTAAYAYAGVILPRTAHTQFYAGPHVPAGAPLLPGDLVFYGVPERVHHVGLYVGYGRMVNAPTFGQPVRLAWVRYPGDDYLGATRPGVGRNGPGLLPRPDLPREVPPVPAPEVPPGPTEFPAPPADPPAARQHHDDHHDHRSGPERAGRARTGSGRTHQRDPGQRAQQPGRKAHHHRGSHADRDNRPHPCAHQRRSEQHHRPHLPAEHHH